MINTTFSHKIYFRFVWFISASNPFNIQNILNSLNADNFESCQVCVALHSPCKQYILTLIYNLSTSALNILSEINYFVIYSKTNRNTIDLRLVQERHIFVYNYKLCNLIFIITNYYY